MSEKQPASGSTLLARWLAGLFHPMIVQLVVLLAEANQANERLYILVFGFVLPVLLYTWYLVRAKAIRDPYSLDRRFRFVPIICNLLGVTACYFYVAPHTHVSSLLFYLIGLNLYVFVVTLFFKISLHAIGTASSAMWLLLHPVWNLPILVLLAVGAMVPMVVWSRWKLKAHTPAELALGTISGIILPFLYVSYYYA